MRTWLTMLALVMVACSGASTPLDKDDTPADAGSCPGGEPACTPGDMGICYYVPQGDITCGTHATPQTCDACGRWVCTPPDGGKAC
jgi:hypothetical protein